MGLPIRFSETPSQFDQPAPELGSSNEEIYGNLLKLTGGELQELKSNGVI
jgi:formyl-CoA transferase